MNQEPNFGKNYWIALILSMVVLMGYPAFIRWMNPELAQPQQQTQAPQNEVNFNYDTNPSTEKARESLSRSENDTSALKPAEGPFIETPIKPTIIPFETDIYQIEFSTLGGTISRLVYKGGFDVPGLTRTVFYEAEEDGLGAFGVRLLHDSADLTRTNFKLTGKGKRNEFVEFTYEREGDYRLIKRFLFEPGSPSIRIEVKAQNLSGREKHFPLEFTYGLNYALENSHDTRFVEVVAKAEKIKKANVSKAAKKGFAVSEPTTWSSILKKYFAIIVKPDWKAVSQDFSGSLEKQRVNAKIKMEPLSVGPKTSVTKSFFVYAGEQQYEVLKAFDYDLESLLSRGWLGTFKIWLLISLNFFYKYTHNYGVAIILLTIVIKLAFTPLTHMSFESMKKMQVLQPKLKALQERYKGDSAKLNQEMMQLYRRNKVNPMMGCLPMLLQIPVFIAFYQALSEAIALKGAPFMLWMQDLSEPDKLFTLPWTLPMLGNGINILPLLMIGSMVWQQKLTPTAAASPEQAKIMAWMPIIFGVMFYNMPSGLVLYWFVNNILSIVHQVFVKRVAVVLHHEDQD